MNGFVKAAACAMLAVSAQVTMAQLTLPSIISDHMVLQRGNAIPIWGKSQPGQTVAVKLDRGDGQPVVSVSTQADENGKWRVLLDTTSAPDQPLELEVQADGQGVQRIRDVLVGQVWICSGQSNMEWRLNNSENAQAHAATANFPRFRQFEVPNTSSFVPMDDVKGHWVVASPDTVPAFSAVGFFFGRELHQKLNVPIGMINSSVGGTDAELWASTESLVKLGQPYVRQVEQGKLIARSLDEAIAAYNVDLEDWAKKLPLYPSKEMLAQYTADDMDDSKWTPVELPTPFHEAFDGSVWYRRDFELKNQPDPKSQVKLSLGRIDDYDLAYINGQKVGGIGHENGSAWATPRNYEFSASVLRQGKNTMVVRVFDVWYGGGFVGIANQMHLTVGNEKVSLAGTWKSLVEVELDLDQRGIAAARPEDPRHAMGVPARLYNGMIHPLQPYAIAGAIWYQGENNAGRFVEYRRLLPAMIESWREAWNQQTQPLIRGEAGRDFPFYIVQLANYMGTTTDPGQISVWAGLRDAQWETAKKVKNSGMAVAIDIGEANDIHPRNKLDVGKRLAAIALNQTYGHNVPYAGPTPTKMTVSQGKVIIQYDHADGGLMVKSLPATDQGQQADSLSEVRGFAIEDESGKWHWATARIVSDNTVEVWNDEAKSPRTVRYGWADNPVVNLYNQAGFPAVPFELKP